MTIPHTAINVTFPKAETKPAGTVIVLKFEDADLGTQARKINKSLNDLIEHAMDANPSFKGKNGQTLELFTGNNTGVKRVFVLGLGKEADITPLTAEDAGGKLAPILLKAGAKDAILVLDTTKKIKAETLAAHIANGFKLRSYDFNRYKSKDKNDKTPKFKTLKVLTQHAANAKAAYDALEHVTSGVFTARDLVNTAPNDLYPDSYAKYIKTELKPLGLDVEILDDKKLEKMGMGGITAVGKGSERKPRMVIIKWSGTKKKSAKTLGFVGKGVTFDTGGISLKPGAGMDEMKMDMGGSAAVVGLLKSLALRKAKCNAVGIVGLAENMPASNAYRPGDIIKSYAGKTIEVLNTDAEGRLVLADCLTYMQANNSNLNSSSIWQP